MPRKTKSKKMSQSRRLKAGTLRPDKINDAVYEPLISSEADLSPATSISDLDFPLVLGSIDHALRHTFPTDYQRRCFYSSTLLLDYLHVRGLSAQLCGGTNFLPTTSENMGGWDGFYLHDQGMPPHLWVSTPECPIIDVMPIYDITSIEGGRRSDPRSALWWHGDQIPFFLSGYIPQIHAGKIEFDSNQQAKFDKAKSAFLFGLNNGKKLKRRILTDKDSIASALRSSDAWIKRVHDHAPVLVAGLRDLKRRHNI
jgi:hypothetical protein